MSRDLSELQNRLGYQFGRPENLLEALTHPSFAHEEGGEARDNQRLEFLGDAVLQVLISEKLFQALPMAPEGAMTKIRASLVCEPTLAEIARDLDLGAYLRLGQGETASGGGDNPSNLADALEALLGSLYLEGGVGAARRAIDRLFSPFWDRALAGQLSHDYKSRLYEWSQAAEGREVAFEVLEALGPEHDRDYKVGLLVNGRLRATGRGKTKKAAEQEASFHFFQEEGDFA